MHLNDKKIEIKRHRGMPTTANDNGFTLKI